MYDSKLIGKNIAIYRMRIQIKQKEVAQKAGISPSYLCDIEKGRVIPSIKKLIAIAEVLDVEPYVLLQ